MSYDRMDNLMDCLNKEAEKWEKEKKELIEEFLDDLKTLYPYVPPSMKEKWEKRSKE